MNHGQTTAPRPRISIEITSRQARILKEHLAYGMQKALFDILIEDLCELVETNGPGILHALMLRRASFKEYLRGGITQGLAVAEHIATTSGGSSPASAGSTGAPEASASKGSEN